MAWRHTHTGNRHAVSCDQAYTVDNAVVVCSGVALESSFAIMTSCHLPLHYAICHFGQSFLNQSNVSYTQQQCCCSCLFPYPSDSTSCTISQTSASWTPALYRRRRARRPSEWGSSWELLSPPTLRCVGFMCEGVRVGCVCACVCVRACVCILIVACCYGILCICVVKHSICSDYRL